ncbi:hypothetical protein [Streptomyces sp. NRRL S-1022]|uniref:hypothetical protein n=1 Tax=Streptomyces sp. NRRL S-1022 TaxID=1463880 RepID=UPI000AE26C9A|nr:hypothetical protein [Streptomyces sp. NRRL S-1022]
MDGPTAARIGRLDQHLDLIGHKAAVCEELGDQGAAARPCHAPPQVPEQRRTPPLP